MAKSYRTHNASVQVASVIGAGTNKIKKKIRDIQRLLNKKRDTLPDTVLVENERILDALHLELKKAELKTLAQKYSKKYHMVRFFERKKALKYYKREAKKKPVDKVEIVEKAIDLCYTVNFPKTEKYISLYSKPSKDGEDSDNSDSDSDNENKQDQITNEKRKFFRDLIRKHYENKTLPLGVNEILMNKTLPNDDLGIVVADMTTPSVSSSSSGNNNASESKAKVQKSTDKNQDSEDEDDEDDDFFE